MRQSGVVGRPGMVAAELPLPVRFLGKLVLEVLPGALASVIGAFLFAYCQFGHAAPVTAPEPATAASPASAEMVQLVREEHAMVRDFLMAQRAAAKKRAEATDAADAQAATDARLAAVSAAKPPASRGKPAVAGSAAAELPPLVIASVQRSTAVVPPVAHASLVSTTLAVPRRVVAVTLHAMMAIGGIPSWIGHRVDAWRLDGDAPSASTAS